MRSRIGQLSLASFLLGLTTLPSLAAANRPVQLEIQIDGKLPFSKRQLAEILQLRLPLVPAEIGTIRAVLRARADQVTVEVGGRSRQAQLPPGDGPAGARLIALLLVDLVTGEIGGEPGEPTTPPPTVSARPSPEGARLVIGLLPTVSVRARDEEVGFEPLLDVRVRLNRWLGIWSQLGYGWAPAAFIGPVRMTFDQLIFRLGVAPRWRYLDFPVGITVRGYWLHSSNPAIEDSSVAVAGLTLGARLTLAFRTVHLFLAAGLDIHAQREVFLYQVRIDHSHDMSAMYSGQVHTNWLVPWFGLGIGFGR